MLAAAFPGLAIAQNMWTNGDFETPSNTNCFVYSASSGQCALNWLTTGMNVRFQDNACSIGRPSVSGTNPGSCSFPNTINPMSASGSGYSAHYFVHRSVWATGVNTRTFALYQPLPANYTSYPFMHFSMNVAALRIGTSGGSVQVGVLLDNGSPSSCAGGSPYTIYSATLPCDQVVSNVTWATMFANTGPLPAGYTRMVVKVAVTRSNSSTVPISVYLDDISFVGSTSMVPEPAAGITDALLEKSAVYADDDGMVLFPNPASDRLQLLRSFEDADAVELTVMDMTGRESFRMRPSTTGITEIPLKDLSPGHYVLSFMEGDVPRQIRFVRE